MENENILRCFQDMAERHRDRTCFSYKAQGQWRQLSWLETLERVTTASESLKKLGIQPQDRVAILAATRYEWTILDMAILSLGAVTVPIYQSSRPDEIAYILKDSESRVLFAENALQLEKVLSVWDSTPTLESVVVIDGVPPPREGVRTFEEFFRIGEGVTSDFSSRIRRIELEQLATIVYTSGTTGVPKGVVLTHANIMGGVRGAQEIFKVQPHEVALMFLPLAHILARDIQFFQLASGFAHSYAESIDKLLDNFKEVSPQLSVSVPRIFEKVYQGVMNGVQNGSALKKAIFSWALKIGREYSRHILQKQKIPSSLQLRYSLAQRLVFSKLHEKLGGKMRFFISGGAPLSREIAEFFHAAGVVILEGYGLTETMAAFSVNRPDDIVFGSVGKPLLGGEIKIADDGEILLRGPMIFQSYWKNPEETRQAFTSDGWFHTGDIGFVDAAGHLKITDRKKDILITAGGKNVAPQAIENLLKTNPLISQAVVHGDRRKYLTALVALCPAQLKHLAQNFGLQDRSAEQLIQDPKIFEEVKKIIEEKNRSLAKHETIKRFAILPRELTIEDGELTPSMKVKRKVVNERYHAMLERLYLEPATGE